MPDPEVWAKYDAIGEDEVRKRIVSKNYAGQNLALAQEWLRRKDQERAEVESSRKDASNREQINIARSAKNAAWIAAIAAIVAAIAAVIALTSSQ